MNKQLAELAAKSGFDVGIHNGLILGNFSDMYKLDKFAELIVKECMEVASPNYMSTPEDSAYYVELAIDRIADHFGVEE